MMCEISNKNKLNLFTFFHSHACCCVHTANKDSGTTTLYNMWMEKNI